MSSGKANDVHHNNNNGGAVPFPPPTITTTMHPGGGGGSNVDLTSPYTSEDWESYLEDGYDYDEEEDYSSESDYDDDQDEYEFGSDDFDMRSASSSAPAPGPPPPPPPPPPLSSSSSYSPARLRLNGHNNSSSGKGNGGGGGGGGGLKIKRESTKSKRRESSEEEEEEEGKEENQQAAVGNNKLDEMYNTKQVEHIVDTGAHSNSNLNQKYRDFSPSQHPPVSCPNLDLYLPDQERPHILQTIVEDTMSDAMTEYSQQQQSQSLQRLDSFPNCLEDEVGDDDNNAVVDVPLLDEEEISKQQEWDEINLAHPRKQEEENEQQQQQQQQQLADVTSEQIEEGVTIPTQMPPFGKDEIQPPSSSPSLSSSSSSSSSRSSPSPSPPPVSSSYLHSPPLAPSSSSNSRLRTRTKARNLTITIPDPLIATRETSCIPSFPSPIYSAMPTEGALPPLPALPLIASDESTLLQLPPSPPRAVATLVNPIPSPSSSHISWFPSSSAASSPLLAIPSIDFASSVGSSSSPPKYGSFDFPGFSGLSSSSPPFDFRQHLHPQQQLQGSEDQLPDSQNRSVSSLASKSSPTHSLPFPSAPASPAAARSVSHESQASRASTHSDSHWLQQQQKREGEPKNAQASNNNLIGVEGLSDTSGDDDDDNRHENHKESSSSSSTSSKKSSDSRKHNKKKAKDKEKEKSHQHHHHLHHHPNRDKADDKEMAEVAAGFSKEHDEDMAERSIEEQRAAAAQAVITETNAYVAANICSVFLLPLGESVQFSEQCYYLRSTLLPGILYVTQNFACFFASLSRRLDETVGKQDYLRKRCSMSWKKRWVTLKEDRVSYYKSSNPSEEYCPLNSIPLDAIDDIVEVKEMPKCFRIVAKKEAESVKKRKKLIFEAENEDQKREWMAALKLATMAHVSKSKHLKLVIEFCNVKDIVLADSTIFSNGIAVTGGGRFLGESSVAAAAAAGGATSDRVSIESSISANVMTATASAMNYSTGVETHLFAYFQRNHRVVWQLLIDRWVKAILPPSSRSISRGERIELLEERTVTSGDSSQSDKTSENEVNHPEVKEEYERIFKHSAQNLKAIFSCTISSSDDHLGGSGRLYITSEAVAFLSKGSKMFKAKHMVFLPISEIKAVKREKTYLVLENAVLITTRNDRKILFISLTQSAEIYAILAAIVMQNRRQQGESSPQDQGSSAAATAENHTETTHAMVIYNTTNIKFHCCFPSIPIHDALEQHQSCALHKSESMRFGDLYLTRNYLCFRSNHKDHHRARAIIPLREIVGIKPRFGGHSNGIFVACKDMQEFLFVGLSGSAATVLFEQLTELVHAAQEPSQQCEEDIGNEDGREEIQGGGAEDAGEKHKKSKKKKICVASSHIQRAVEFLHSKNSKFHHLFGISKDELLVDDFRSVLMRKLPVKGHLFLSRSFLAFSAVRLGEKHKIVVPMADIASIRKNTSHLFFNSCIEVTTHDQQQWQFAVSGDFDLAFTLLNRLWKNKEMELQALEDSRQNMPESTEDFSEEMEKRMEDVIEKEAVPIKPPPLNFVILTIGSRGDVQPYVALGQGLKRDGHSVAIATHEEFEGFVTSHGLEWRKLAGDPKKLMDLCVTEGMFTPGFFSKAVAEFSEFIDSLLVSAYAACTQGRTDVILATPPCFAGVHIAEKLNLPFFSIFTMPFTRTKEFPNPFAVLDVKLGPGYNIMSHKFVLQAMWQGTRGAINKFRTKVLKIPEIGLTEGNPLDNKKIPVLYCFSKHLVPKPKDWPSHVYITGFWFLDDQPPPPPLSTPPLPSASALPSEDLAAKNGGGGGGGGLRIRERNFGEEEDEEQQQQVANYDSKGKVRGRDMIWSEEDILHHFGEAKRIQAGGSNSSNSNSNSNNSNNTTPQSLTSPPSLPPPRQILTAVTPKRILPGLPPLPPPLGAPPTPSKFTRSASGCIPPPGLAEFLEGADGPIYIGFGSIVGIDDPAAFTQNVIKAIELSGKKCVFMTGWANLAEGQTFPPNIFPVSSISHNWLFPKMSCVIHHGGAGTVAAGLRCGIPTIIVPFFGDQWWWSVAIHKMEVGTWISSKKLTAQKLAEKILEVTSSVEFRERAAILGRKISSEDGISNAISVIYKHLPQTGMSPPPTSSSGSRYY